MDMNLERIELWRMARPGTGVWNTMDASFYHSICYNVCLLLVHGDLSTCIGSVVGAADGGRCFPAAMETEMAGREIATTRFNAPKTSCT